MANKFRKINQLHNTESFLQANTVKGFKYIDKAGELVNIYHLEEKSPKFQMDIQALVFNEPTTNINQLKISSRDIWAKFVEPSSLDLAMTSFINEVKKISEILDVQIVNRIGWRNYFIYDFLNREEKVKFLNNISKLDYGTAVSTRIDFSATDKIKANLLIEIVVKEDDDKTEAVLFDLDLFILENINLTDLKSNLTSMREYLTSDDGFIKSVNSSFQ